MLLQKLDSCFLKADWPVSGHDLDSCPKSQTKLQARNSHHSHHSQCHYFPQKPSCDRPYTRTLNVTNYSGTQCHEEIRQTIRTHYTCAPDPKLATILRRNFT
jgi:hypothetical protein